MKHENMVPDAYRKCLGKFNEIKKRLRVIDKMHLMTHEYFTGACNEVSDAIDKLNLKPKTERGKYENKRKNS